MDVQSLLIEAKLCVPGFDGITIGYDDTPIQWHIHIYSTEISFALSGRQPTLREAFEEAISKL